MKIIIKFLLKNIYEKKFRTFLIVFSVMLSSALFFASSAISGTMVKMYLDRMTQYYGSSDIVIHGNEKSPSGFIDTNNASPYKNQLDYVIGATQGSGSFSPNNAESVNLTLQGISLDDLYQMNKIVLLEERNLLPFSGRKIIISKNTSEKYNLKIGGIFQIKINNNLQRFQICGIAQPVGPFIEDGQTTYTVIPNETLSAIYNARGKSTVLYIKLKNPNDIVKMIETLSKAYPRYTVREPISQEDLKRQTSQMSVPFMLMTIIVSFMSIFIIYTSFKVLTMERLPVIGTFRSIGATRKTTDTVLLVESTIYGIIGGAFGCILGIGILYIMAMNSPYTVWNSGFKATVQFSTSQLLNTFIMAVILCLISSLLPIIKVSKMPIKDIVLNAIEKKKKKHRGNRNLFCGVILLVLSIIVPRYSPYSLAMFLDAICMLLSVVSVVMLIPYLTGGFIKVFETIYMYFFGNIGILAAKNLRENKSILNSISLLTIGISSLIMINTVSYSVLTQISSFYTNNARFQIYMSDRFADKNLSRLIKTIDGVTDVYGAYEFQQIEVIGQKEKIGGIKGVDNKYFEFSAEDIGLDPQKLVTELETGRNVLLTNALKDKFGLKAGDYIKLKMRRAEVLYKVLGFFNNTLDYGGSVALVSEKYLKTDMKSNYFSQLYIKTNKDPDYVVKQLKAKFALRQPWVRSTMELKKMDLTSNGQMFSQLQGFSIMTLLIGILGIFNNLLISFIERKRSLAMFKSCGMSRKQILKMIFIEAFTGGLIGSIVGIIAGVLMVIIVPYVMIAIGSPMPISINYITLFYSFIIGVIIMLIASISPAMRSSKLNIIDALKYE